jgi:predicted histidine transporter YuiF (NhaC family)
LALVLALVTTLALALVLALVTTLALALVLALVTTLLIAGLFSRLSLSDSIPERIDAVRDECLLLGAVREAVESDPAERGSLRSAPQHVMD